MATEALGFRTPAPVSVFISYAHEDEALKNELLKHLSLLKRQDIISHWHDREIRAGAEWSKEIDSHLESARIVLLLVSSDFLASDYCYEKEMNRALEKHDSGQARVIPIFLRPCDWTRAPFGQIQGLPFDAKPVTEWPSRDAAFDVIAKGIRIIAEQFQLPLAGGAEAIQSGTVKRTALHQLPPSPADFTGRVDDITELIKAVREKQARILGIFGMGGLGKTALVLKVADQIKDDYPDGQIYLDLRGVSAGPLQPKDAMAHVIRSFDLTSKLPETGPEIAALYRSVLHARKVLLLMDNAADEKQVELLIPSSSCLLLVTSRMHFTLPGLVEKNLDVMAPEDSKALLLRITARLEQAGDQCIADLAHFCGHLPLALRIAANALHMKKSLKPTEYVRRLRHTNQRLGELKEVEASLQVSYDLLSERMQARFRSLAVFPDTFDTEAAAAIWAVEQDIADDSLEKLLLYSLIEFNESLCRFRFHDLVRLFMDSRLIAEECYTAQRRHAEYYLHVLKTANDLYLEGGNSVVKGLARFDVEWRNIQAGRAWAEAHANQDKTAAQCCCEYPAQGLDCLSLRQLPREQIVWLEAGLATAVQCKNREKECFALVCLGAQYRVIGNYQRSVECLMQSLKIARETGDRQAEGSVLGNLGATYGAMGDFHRAIEYCEQRLKISSEIGDRHGAGTALGNLGSVYGLLGEYRHAVEYHERSLKIIREFGNPEAETDVLGNLGNDYVELKEYSSALKYFDEAIRIARDIGYRAGEAGILWNSSIALIALGDRRTGIARAEAALKIFEDIEHPGVPNFRNFLAKWREEEKANAQAAE